MPKNDLGSSETPRETRCPGCGLALPVSGAPAPDGFNASGECFERYGELTAYTVSLGDPAFPHQFAVDAYAAQHAGPASRPITTIFALVGLYLASEHGLSGRAVQRAHSALAQGKRDWPRLSASPPTGALTVLDVLDSPPGAARVEALRRWVASVWSLWSEEQDRVRALVAERLPGPLERFERSQRGPKS